MSLVLSELKNEILHVTLNGTTNRNALTIDMIGELSKVFTQAEKSKEIRAVFLSGAGPVFCAGADLNQMRESIHWSKQKNESEAKRIQKLFVQLHGLSKVLVSFVHGGVYGGGLGLLAISDLVFADPQTKFSFTEVRLGIVPAVISPFIFQRANPAHVKRWMLLGEIFSAEQAKAAGLVDNLENVNNFEIHQEDLGVAILKSGPLAMQECKKLMRSAVVGDLQKLLKETPGILASLRSSDEGQEGLQSFFEKRSPTWSKRE